MILFKQQGRLWADPDQPVTRNLTAWLKDHHIDYQLTITPPTRQDVAALAEWPKDPHYWQPGASVPWIGYSQIVSHLEADQPVYVTRRAPRDRSSLPL